MLIFKALHVLSMVTMVTAFIGAEIFYASAFWRRDGHLLASVQRTVERTGTGIVAVLALLAGIVFGVLAAATGGFDFLGGWLIAAYVLLAFFFINSAVFGMRAVQLGKEAMEAEDAGQQLEEVERRMPANLGITILTINAVLFAAIIADMILKPF